MKHFFQPGLLVRAGPWISSLLTHAVKCAESVSARSKRSTCLSSQLTWTHRFVAASSFERRSQRCHFELAALNFPSSVRRWWNGQSAVCRRWVHIRSCPTVSFEVKIFLKLQVQSDSGLPVAFEVVIMFCQSFVSSLKSVLQYCIIRKLIDCWNICWRKLIANQKRMWKLVSSRSQSLISIVFSKMFKASENSNTGPKLL